MPTKPGVMHPGKLKYAPRYCAELVDFMGRGYSLTAFAGEIGTTRANLLTWCDKHRPFAVALERAQARRARVLEDHLINAKGPRAFDLQMEALRTSAPEDWRRDAMTTSKAPTRVAPSIGLDLPDNDRDI